MSNLMRIPQSGAIAINEAVDRMNTLTVFVGKTLQDGLDYGKIPGCGDKPILYKPGAEKIATLFGFYVNFDRLEAVKDYTGKDHGGEAFFAFEYMATLKNREGDIVAQCEGSCNSWEDKYRWRKAERTCPQCGEPAIKKSRKDGSWYCWNKPTAGFNGCGAKFQKGDPSVESQEVGRVPNERIYDQVNTIQKMAQKRCLGSSTKVFLKTSRGVSLSKLETVWAIYQNDNEEMFLPGVDGGWRKIEGMIQDHGRPVFRIDLADGTWIRATAEHRFPTKDGLKRGLGTKSWGCIS